VIKSLSGVAETEDDTALNQRDHGIGIDAVAQSTASVASRARLLAESVVELECVAVEHEAERSGNQQRPCARTRRSRRLASGSFVVQNAIVAMAIDTA
jgi:hypothetical protein